jgi:hypothetical protein
LCSLVPSAPRGPGTGAPFWRGWRYIRLIHALRNIQTAILLPLSCVRFLVGSRKRLSSATESLMPITKLPEMVACAGAVLVSSDSRARSGPDGDFKHRGRRPLYAATLRAGDDATDRSNHRVAPHARLSRSTGDLSPINRAVGPSRSRANRMRTIGTDGRRGLSSP